jgi:hypothetical protein
MVALDSPEIVRILFSARIFRWPRYRFIDQNIAALGTLTYMSEVEKSAIYQNARRLFRRLAAETSAASREPSIDRNHPDGLVNGSFLRTRVPL